MIVEVFKTNIQTEEEALLVMDALEASFHSCRINFDLDDLDNILRIEAEDICAKDVIEVLNKLFYQCECLPD